ncbi:c-type cytochrome [Phenylobacterium sp.]|uniref:cytochrome c oxidase subunit II n=1 Tax=Phenylobacterium sp. TaxID=1871053 RepID=UPI0037852379
MRRAAVLLPLGLAACAGQQSVLDPAGDQAQVLHGLLGLIVAICGVAYLLVMVLLAAAIWRGRRKLAATLHPPDVSPDDRRLERGLAGWVGFIVVGLSVMVIASFLVDRTLAKDGAAPPDVRITGHQWWWRVQYWDAPTRSWIEAANELHLPVDRPTRIELVAADVIHSFWVPNLSGKLDMVPGRVNQLTLTPRRTGWLRGQCGEFCGLQHAEMALNVKVESVAEYAAWRTGQARPAAAPADPVAVRGQSVFAQSACATCHTIRGVSEQGRAGPDLTHVGSRRSIAAGTLPMSHAALMGWIANPQDHKPGAEMPTTGLPPADVDAVARYLGSLE